MPPTPQTPHQDQPDPFEITPGFPTHLHDRTAAQGHLSRCGLFASGAPARMTDQVEKVTCYDCLAEGPAAAYVELPDGQIVDRRSGALRDRPYAVVELRETPDGSQWRLGTWEDGIGDAEFMLGYRFRGRTARIVPVQFAGSGK